MKCRVTNIFEGIYKKYGINELLYCLMEKYHISFMNLDLRSVNVSFSDRDIIIYEEKSKRRFIIHNETEYFTFTKENSDYNEIFYMDFNGDIFRQTAIFTTGNGKLLIVDGLNDENIQSRRITRTTIEDKSFLNGDFERDFTTINNGLIDEEYSYRRFSDDKVVGCKKITLPDDGMYFQLESSYSTSYLSVSSKTRIEVSASLKTPTIKFRGRVRNQKEIFNESITSKTANAIVSVVQENGNNFESFKIVFTKQKGYLKIEIFRYIGNKVIKINETYKKGVEGDNLSSFDIDVLIDCLSNELDNNCINQIVQELLKLKALIKAKENGDNKVVDLLDFRIKHFNNLSELIFDVKNNLDYYEKIIDSQTREVDKHGETLKKV